MKVGVNMSGLICLHVKGDEYAAMYFEERYEEQEFYERMKKDGVESKQLNIEGLYVEVTIKRFGAVDDKFLDFIRGSFIDYDEAKTEKFFIVYDK
ncbi:hypothetical protein CN357_04910 [Bacillus cereus]|uniref:Uncharacterized protein n=3 Tax=Bacillaceae TaxID=186817 RepID=A0A9X0SPT4_BACCE|nr:hypothetical protein [Bacillus thuringiensis]KXY50991.1 hypothetical protein AT268_31095 [Bacillus cereus]PGB15683.1 hypothetical protein COM09_08870 [Bacillus toyonensis]PES55539.1 hypothetical protein CN515_05710 [Bacillus cereus]PFA29341.1 hypothetical protein CN384_06270 [Bacillus thuringiensis]PFF52032.1 hypothetical protein CN357_04910 [Bacillus cereus]